MTPFRRSQPPPALPSENEGHHPSSPPNPGRRRFLRWGVRLGLVAFSPFRKGGRGDFGNRKAPFPPRHRQNRQGTIRAVPPRPLPPRAEAKG